MMATIDKKFRKEKFLAWEIKSLTDKNSLFSFSKAGWKTTAIIVFILVAVAFIAPILPPRYGRGNWMPPTTWDQYRFEVTNAFITIPLIIISVVIYITVRSKIDLALGYKRTANFKVTEVLDFGILKIAVLNKWRLFFIKRRDINFHSVNEGQIITIKRTGTFRLISYYARDEKIFNNETAVG
jgi:hypothetical protein